MLLDRVHGPELDDLLLEVLVQTLLGYQLGLEVDNLEVTDLPLRLHLLVLQLELGSSDLLVRPVRRDPSSGLHSRDVLLKVLVPLLLITKRLPQHPVLISRCLHILRIKDLALGGLDLKCRVDGGSALFSVDNWD